MKEERLEPEDAARLIQAAQGWDVALRSRTLGLMWMAWAFIAAGTFLSYSVAAANQAEYPPWFALLWMPWAGLGTLFTLMLWRSVGIVSPQGAPSARTVIAHVAVFLLATIGGVILVFATKLPVLPPTAVLFGIGTITTGIGITHLRRSPSAALPKLAIGLALITVAIIEAFRMAPLEFIEGVHRAAFVNAAWAGLGLFLVGLFQYWRR